MRDRKLIQDLINKRLGIDITYKRNGNIKKIISKRYEAEEIYHNPYYKN